MGPLWSPAGGGVAMELLTNAFWTRLPPSLGAQDRPTLQALAEWSVPFAAGAFQLGAGRVFLGVCPWAVRSDASVCSGSTGLVEKRLRAAEEGVFVSVDKVGLRWGVCVSCAGRWPSWLVGHLPDCAFPEASSRVCRFCDGTWPQSRQDRRLHSWPLDRLPLATPRVCVLSWFSHVRLMDWLLSESYDLWTVARQAPLSMGFPRQKYWSGLPCPPPGDLPDPGIELTSLMFPVLTGVFFTTSSTWEAKLHEQVKLLGVGKCVSKLLLWKHSHHCTHRVVGCICVLFCFYVCVFYINQISCSSKNIAHT